MGMPFAGRVPVLRVWTELVEFSPTVELNEPCDRHEEHHLVESWSLTDV
jgi:hypothetical protein